jgi:pimeloyl-ACP methyl ester carboxylesterase
MKRSLLFILLFSQLSWLHAQVLPGFKPSGIFGEQQMIIENAPADTRILINAPLNGFGANDHVLLVFFALPNGNTIEQTFGKVLKDGDDWHYNIQHIGAQTRYLRGIIREKTIVTVYVEARQKSWPAWKAATPDYSDKVKSMVDDVTAIFSQWHPDVVLNGHSGGGRFIFSFLDAVPRIPDDIKRIAFIDSDYGYEDSIYGSKLVKWLKSGRSKRLCVLAYNDSVALYDGKPVVSATGGTWYHTHMMKSYLSSAYRFHERDHDTLQWYFNRGNRVEFVLKTNPDRKIFHTQQVEFNGFIHSMLSGTKREQKGYSYFGKREYSAFISDTVPVPVRRLNIPPRAADAESGSAFMNRVSELPREEREEEIFKAIASGNVPQFLRNTVTLTGDFMDANCVSHHVIYEVMPDYLSVGSDTDFCRVPMSPCTAQRLADLFGASLLTSRLSDEIYLKAKVRPEPFYYAPVANANEQVSKFVAHNAYIEKQLFEMSAVRGDLVAGIKKDVILSSRIALQPGKVVIYGWHKPDGNPIQPVYSGHINWYVDYSHGIRFINNQVLVDGKRMLLSDLLTDPVLFSMFSYEEGPMTMSSY